MAKLFASASRNAEYHNLFKNIPEEELLIDSYSCALSREILIHGRLYLSANYICFNANLLGWVTNEIVAVEKKMTALIIPNGIALSTLHERHVYASFLKRDDAFNKIVAVWRNCTSDQPIPTTELLAQVASGKTPTGPAVNSPPEESPSAKRFRERRLSSMTHQTTTAESTMESIMSDDSVFPQTTATSSLDPALTVRREFNFGASRLPSATGSDEIGWRTEDAPIDPAAVQETDEEQREVRESIFPCACAFHYKSTIVDQLVLLPLNHVIQALLFTPKNSVTCAPRAFIEILKQLKAEDVTFSPWKVYLGKWERRIWTCRLPASKLLLSDSLLKIKVTDSVICRQVGKVCIESLMQVDGVPGGGCFVKWKLCATAPGEGTVNAQDQCRITITAAAAAPLGSWFKESIRSALLFQAEELWTRAIECAVNLPESDDSSPAPLSSASKSSSTTSLAPLLLTDKLSSVNLVYFDRKLFFKSLTRMITALGLVALTIALLVGRKNKPQASPSPTSPNTAQSKNAAILEAQYLNYLQRKLHLDNSLPDEFIHVASQLTELDGRVSGMVRRMQSIKRFMHDDYQVFGEE